ncbi:hypothetical protein ACROYT_G029420 [Oculina patagonica]
MSSSFQTQEHGEPHPSASKLKVTILTSDWESKKGALSTINRELAKQLAKCPEVEITLFLPQCSEEDKSVALSHKIHIVEATRRPGYDELEWLSFPPDHLNIDVIVGHGVKLGRQAQVIRETHKCKWIQVVHTDPEELMLKSDEGPISKGKAVAQFNDAHLVYVAAPEGRHEDITKRLLECGIPANRLTVRSFVGTQSELKRLFCEVDLLLMTSRPKGFGLIGLEALSAGLPVLVSRNSGFGEALHKVPFGSSCVIDSEDAKVWAEAIKEIWSKDRETRLQEAAMLRFSYEKKFSWAKQSRDLVTKMISVTNDCQSSSQGKDGLPGLSITQSEQRMTVPQELIARGSQALEAYNKALTEGTTFDKRVPIMIIGQERSGKTSLKRSLRGEPFNQDEESTEGIDVDPSHFKLTTETWQIGKEGQQINSETSISFEYHAARATVENLRQEEKAPDPEERIPDSMQSGNIAMDDKVTAGASNDFNSDPSEVEVVIPSGSSLTNDITSASSSCTRSHDQSSNAAAENPESVRISRHPEQESSIPRNVETEILKRLKNDTKEEDEEGVHSVLWDFAGQSVYYTTHPLFLTSRAIYLLVNDLSQNPFGPTKPIPKQGLYTELEDSYGLKTNFDCLDFWMSSVASLASQQESDQVSYESKVLPEKLPAVFLVCTHADKSYSGHPSRLANKIYGALQAKPYETHLHDRFVVDNKKSGSGSECPEVLRLRKEVLTVSEELPQMKEAIPIKWLKFEKELQGMRESGEKWITLKTAKRVASEKCNIVDDTEFRTLLNFLHDKRILIPFDGTRDLDKLVILDPQWLIDVFKKVITVRPYSHEEKKFKELWHKLQDDGILEEKLIEHAWSPLFDSKETSESLLAIMEKFSLLCAMPSSDASCAKQYLVPSMLMSYPPEDIVELIKSAQMPSIFLRFQSGHVPPGLFPRLVLQFFQWNKEKCVSPDNYQLYRNFARFHTHEQENCSVILLCHSLFIQVVVYRENASHDLPGGSAQSKLSLSVDASHDAFDVKCARDVRRQLDLMLDSMRNEFCWLKNMRYEVCSICSVCCTGVSVNYCRTHCAEGCKKEECLHFWPESEICNKESISCKKNAAAPITRVQIEEIAPWLVPPGCQLTACGRDGRALSTAQARKEVALPDEVLEALLSQTCDAKEVVRQLGKTMLLDQASLQELAPETKTLIRSLARQAKNSNRPDVFEHLREITPAGTTGPRLPENRDVRYIPFHAMRELTIDLSGGDEWKEIAEALGLSQPEIRFLDNRTLNPLDAALAFIAKQRHITVGELYDLLNEKGFPVIADLL